MNIKNIIAKLKRAYHTSKGRNIFTFMVFLVISTIFWLMMALNETVQRSYRMPLTITDIPEGVTLISTPPATVDISVRDKGHDLIKFDWGNAPKLNLSYNDFIEQRGNRLVITGQQLATRVAGVFGADAEVAKLHPDSLSLLYTTRPGEKLPLVINADVHADAKSVICGAITADIDSAVIYSISALKPSEISLSTEKISLENLSDTTTVEAEIIFPKGTMVEPRSVTVTIPVEPLVARSRKLNISVKNLPSDKNISIKPEVVTVNYYMPKTRENQEYSITAYVNYRDIVSGKTTLPVSVGDVPEYFRIVNVSPSSVEFSADSH